MKVTHSETSVETCLDSEYSTVSSKTVLSTILRRVGRFQFDVSQSAANNEGGKRKISERYS